jgi:phosphoribosylpyrophosphate synthetase
MLEVMGVDHVVTVDFHSAQIEVSLTYNISIHIEREISSSSKKLYRMC